MSCTYNHNDSTKKFCPECGTKMTVDLTTRLNELLKEVITENKYTEFNPKDNSHMKQLLVKMMDNEISIKGKGNFVIFNNEITMTHDFSAKYPFFSKGASDYETVDNMFFIPINFEQKQKDWKRCIPSDVPYHVKYMLNNIMDTFDRKLYVEDNDKVITALKSYCDKNTKQRGKYTDIDYLEYFLQNINLKIDDNNFYLNHQSNCNSEDRFVKISLIEVNENNLRFVICDEDDKPALRFTKNKVIRCNMKGYWNDSSSTDSVKKEDIKKWFEDRPSTFKRDSDIETEFLKTVSD